ncbi:MAG: 8-amino-7-oxononanoate synthase, partial [Candidatus Zixiibacteriota bacterium]
MSQPQEKIAVAITDLFERAYNFTAAKDVMAMGIYPYFHPVQSAPGNDVLIDGHKCIMVGSNNYLGLVDHPKVKQAAADAAMKYGSGCTGSRFLNGTLDLH